jgi:hypothetical protein
MLACDRDVQYRRMDNSQNNSASASPAEEQVQRVEEAAAGSNPVEGNPSAGNMAPQAQTQTAQNIAQGDAATPLKTGVRQRGDTEKQGKGGRSVSGTPRSSTNVWVQACIC